MLKRAVGALQQDQEVLRPAGRPAGGLQLLDQRHLFADEIRTWLYARHPQLDGKRAIDLINQNRSEEILRILDRLDSDVYL